MSKPRSDCKLLRPETRDAFFPYCITHVHSACSYHIIYVHSACPKTSVGREKGENGAASLLLQESILAGPGARCSSFKLGATIPFLPSKSGFTQPVGGCHGTCKFMSVCVSMCIECEGHLLWDICNLYYCGQCNKKLNSQ